MAFADTNYCPRLLLCRREEKGKVGSAMAGYSELLLGIDLGTSSVKTVMFDTQGQVRATAVREYPVSRPRPGWAEQDPQQWWQATVESLGEVLAQVPGPPIAVGIDAQSSALVALDEGGRPLRPALLWLDRRAQAQCDYIRQIVPEDEILRLSGNRLDPSYILPKVLWLREEEPDNYRRARYFLHANGFLIHRLTGEATTDLTEGGMSLLYDISQDDWSPALLDKFELPAERFPPMHPPSQVVGEVTAWASEWRSCP